MKVTKTNLDGVLLVEPRVFNDPRGFFMETYSKKVFQENGIEPELVQDNHSYSSYGVLRGLHFQVNQPQAKLVRVVEGEIFDVAVDIRPGSPTFGKWTGHYLSSENKHQLFVPAGFAHGFCVTSKTVTVLYKCSDYYSPPDERGLIWNDSEVGIDWPVKEPLLSEKDTKYPQLSGLNLEEMG